MPFFIPTRSPYMIHVVKHFKYVYWSRCEDYFSSPFSAVLIPEPVDYFRGCAATSFCRAKCLAEFDAFDSALQASVTESVLLQESFRVVESRFFTDITEDTYTPMNIMNMIELSNCADICGPSWRNDQAAAGTFVNADTCIAIVGVDSKSDMVVKKYCVPRMQGRTVTAAPASENWIVYGVGVKAVVSVHFLDSEKGDQVVVLRDNMGSILGAGYPSEHVVTVHSKLFYVDPLEVDILFSDNTGSMNRLGIAATSTFGAKARGIGDIFVVPGYGTRAPWVFLGVIESTGSIYESPTNIYCSGVYLPDKATDEMRAGNDFVEFAECPVQGIFDTWPSAGYIPVVLNKNSAVADNLVSLQTMRILLVPTIVGYDLCEIEWTLDLYAKLTKPSKSPVCVNTPESFVTGRSFPVEAGATQYYYPLADVVLVILQITFSFYRVGNCKGTCGHLFLE